MAILNYAPPTSPYMDILYRDDDLIVLNKPSGLLSVPGKAEEHKGKQTRKKCSLLTAAFLTVLCCLSGFWAIIGGLVGSKFEIGEIRFSFTVTTIITLTLAGGLILALLQYWLTKVGAATTLRVINRFN